MTDAATASAESLSLADVPDRPWSVPAGRVEESLQTDPERGLTDREARHRLERFGPNRLRRLKQRSIWRILLDQVESPVVWLLLGAAAAAMAFRAWTDAGAIGVVLLINTSIGFVTELRARRSMESLQKMGQVEASVVRNGLKRRVPSEDVVVGDVLVLAAGEVVAADVRLVGVDNLQVDESALTGESVPVQKWGEPIDESALLPDRTSMAFKGTAVTQGAARGIVVHTGMSTELGNVSELVEQAAREEDTPLQRQLQQLAQRLVWLTIAIAAAVGGAGIVADRGLLSMIQIAVALAVAAIPEGLPVVATIALARGVHRMVQRQALVRKLSSVHTLGATSVICSDKTGTLTENRMRVRRLRLPDGEIQAGDESVALDDDAAARLSIEVAALCNEARLVEGEQTREEGDPMEIALLDLARRGGLAIDDLLQRRPRVRLVPFSPQTKMMASVHAMGETFLVAVKGAPEAVLDASTHVFGRDEEHELGERDREGWQEANEVLAGQGLRVLGLAYKRVEDADVDIYTDLRFLGLVGLMDPPRAGVEDAVRQCREAGIRVIMVTGDQPATAAAIARDIGLVDDREVNVVHGREFDAKGDDVTKAAVLARVDPEQKLRLVGRLQESGEVVAMTGDGVNDAPALKRADIGIAMGMRGTDVAREAADMVLLDDAFETIVTAVRQGRIIFDNIRKFVVYLLSGNVGEILAIGATALSSAPLPLTALQILYLNMLNDVFPALALGVGPGGSGVLQRPPRDPREPILARRQWTAIFAYGIVIGITLLGVFGLALLVFDMSEPQAVTVAFLSLSIGRLLHAFNMRDRDSGITDNDIARNPWMWAAIVLCLALLAIAVYVPPLAEVLDLSTPPAHGWLLVAGASVVPLLVGQMALEVRKRRAS